MFRKLGTLLLFLALTLAASAASAVHFHFSTDDNVSIEGDDVVLHPDGEPRAVIAASGDLRIDGRRIETSLKDRMLLVRYNQSVHAIVAEALDLGMQGASIGVHALTAALVGLVTGDGENAKRAVEPQARRMKQRGRALCLEARTLQQVQDEIAKDVQEFRPYAVIDVHDKHQCEVED
jgi:hypothetical protein